MTPEKYGVVNASEHLTPQPSLADSLSRAKLHGSDLDSSGLDSSFDGEGKQVPHVAVAEPENAQPWRDPAVRVRYAVLDVPPWYECLFLGFQHYLTMLGSTVLIPFLLVPAMGGTGLDLAHVIGTIFFMSGWITLMQTVIGDRLPIVQGGSFAYLTPAFALIGQVKANAIELGLGQDDPVTGTNHERFLYTMRLLSGGIIGSAFFIMFIGGSGILSLILHWISPITVAANIAIVGLALFSSGFTYIGQCPQLGLPLIFFLILFSQYMKNIAIPLPWIGRFRLFELFPVLLAIAVTWVYAIIVTEAGAYPEGNPPPGIPAAQFQGNNFHNYCRTKATILSDSPWGRWPYPCQFGSPIFTWSSVLTMLAGALSAMVESLGDYYAAARIAGAPVPPPEIIARAVFIQGFSCVLTGLVGTGNGTTAYNENIGAMQITRVGSRRVVQVGSAIIIVVSIIGKFGGLFASMPVAMVGGLFCVMFGLIAAVGLSQLQFTDMNSPRNIFIMGFGLFMGLSVPYYFNIYYANSCLNLTNTVPTNAIASSNCTTNVQHYPINTGDETFNQIFNAIFDTAAAVTLIITMILDNTIPGTIEERGLHVWALYKQTDLDWWDDERLHAVYGWPFGLSKVVGRKTKPFYQRRDAVFIAIGNFFESFKFWRRKSRNSALTA